MNSEDRQRDTNTTHGSNSPIVTGPVTNGVGVSIGSTIHINSSPAPTPVPPASLTPAVEPVGTAPAPRTSADSLELTLRFLPHDAGATVMWESSAIGSRRSDYQHAYDDATVGLVLKALDAVQWPDYPHEGPTFTAAEQARLASLGLWSERRVAPDIHLQIGRHLYQAITVDPRGADALKAVRDAAIFQDLPLHYTLRFPPDAARLAILPWELLRDMRGPLLFSGTQLGNCVRYLDLDNALPPETMPRKKLRVVSITPHVGLSREILAAERKARQAALEPLLAREQAELVELSPATIRCVVDYIQREGPADVVHFYGHGAFLPERGGYLQFDPQHTNSAFLRTEQLATLFAGTRLVVLHACHSAAINGQELLAGIAPALSAAGIPAVIGMQLSFQIDVAMRFFTVLYGAIVRGDAVQVAMSRARQALFIEESGGSNWYVPTLTIRARSSRPFVLLS